MAAAKPYRILIVDDQAVTAFVWIFVLSFLALVLVGIGGSMGWIK